MEGCVNVYIDLGNGRTKAKNKIKINKLLFGYSFTKVTFILKSQYRVLNVLTFTIPFLFLFVLSTYSLIFLYYQVCSRSILQGIVLVAVWNYLLEKCCLSGFLGETNPFISKNRGTSMNAKKDSTSIRRPFVMDVPFRDVEFVAFLAQEYYGYI